MRKIDTARTCDGQWIACYSDTSYPNVKRDTQEEAIAALRTRAHA